VCYVAASYRRVEVFAVTFPQAVPSKIPMTGTGGLDVGGPQIGPPEILIGNLEKAWVALSADSPVDSWGWSDPSLSRAHIHTVVLPNPWTINPTKLN
jgi:hypothetical protein